MSEESQLPAEREKAIAEAWAKVRAIEAKANELHRKGDFEGVKKQLTKYNAARRAWQALKDETLRS